MTRKLTAILLSVFLLFSLAANVFADGETEETDAGYAVTFTADGGCTITAYKTQTVDDTGEVVLSVAAGGSGTDVSRSSTTGEPDSTGDGQVNFVVTLADGYTLDAVTATEGTYKNIKQVSADEESGVYVYRVTKITGETTVAVTTTEAESDNSDPVFTFTDSGVTHSGSSVGWTIDGTTLTITAAGEYTVTGSCSEGSIVVAKGVTDVTLHLTDLTLESAETAPLVLKKSAAVTLDISGAVTLIDSEDPDNETSADTTVADAFEGAAIKVKSGASLTITGDGILTVDGASCKNGVKGAAEATVKVAMDGTLCIKAANNGLAADGQVIIESGTLDIEAGNEGVKSEPDETDTASAGMITVSGGSITIDAAGDGMQAANGVTITGGTLSIAADCDGIQSNADLTISDGTFEITTLTGCKDSSFDSDTMSAKGLKASASDDDTEDATNTITITGGTFTLNTADDAIHSDGYVVITGGTFDIYTGDDGVHADTSLTLGSESGLDRDPDITVHYSYEGLEAGNVYIYGGKYYVCATDDGVNAAGGSSNGSDPGAGGGNHFNPGGGPGGPGQQSGSSSSSDYSLNIYGGNVYINADGDGLDSNGNLNITGGIVEVWGQTSGGDNDALDCDGTLNIGSDAIVFAAGSTSGADYRSISSKAKTVSVSKNSTVTVKSGSTTVYQTAAPKAVGYVYYSGASSYTVTTGSSSASCAYSNAWSHTWNSGVITTAATTEATGVITYTCTVCGETETQTIPALTAEEEEAETDAGYAVTFTADAGCTITVYKTQTVDDTGETVLTVAAGGSGTDVSRSSTNGEPDSTGDGQVNFVVTLADGYSLDAVTATEGTYKNIKQVSADEDSGIYVYRVTKITGETTVAVTTTEAESAASGDLNGDGTVNMKDVLQLRQYLAGGYGAEATDETADVNGDGSVNMRDLLMLRQYLAGGYVFTLCLAEQAGTPHHPSGGAAFLCRLKGQIAEKILKKLFTVFKGRFISAPYHKVIRRGDPRRQNKKEE